MTESTKDATKTAAGWSAVVLAIVTGITGGARWVGDHVVDRLMDNYDAMEANAKTNTEILGSVRDQLATLNQRYAVGLKKQDETHTLQRTQIGIQETQVEEQKKAAEILKAAVPRMGE